MQSTTKPSWTILGSTSAFAKILWLETTKNKKEKKQAGAELCQAQVKLG
jgi:hypothetical protein